MSQETAPMNDPWTEHRVDDVTYFSIGSTTVGYVEHAARLPRALACLVTTDGRVVALRGTDDECLGFLRGVALEALGCES
jgi:hypothetical protein